MISGILLLAYGLVIVGSIYAIGRHAQKTVQRQAGLAGKDEKEKPRRA